MKTPENFSWTLIITMMGWKEDGKDGPFIWTRKMDRSQWAQAATCPRTTARSRWKWRSLPWPQLAPLLFINHWWLNRRFNNGLLTQPALGPRKSQDGNGEAYLDLSWPRFCLLTIDGWIAVLLTACQLDWDGTFFLSQMKILPSHNISGLHYFGDHIPRTYCDFDYISIPFYEKMESSSPRTVQLHSNCSFYSIFTWWIFHI